jgi:hypothetical protein
MMNQFLYFDHKGNADEQGAEQASSRLQSHLTSLLISIPFMIKVEKLIHHNCPSFSSDSSIRERDSESDAAVRYLLWNVCIYDLIAYNV